ncbi:MAG: Acyl-[acyl-carrier-protein]--UDP-N-acetylglucosamine O-acyltransferase [Gammaproteobacteria bacterium]|nr:Acyl-[acyl-carrier-protein]--UDP-N-acetylglucosamine O-acyltransferase [Gammaproteobacteria bacterium]
MIDSRAIIEPGAEIGEEVTVGPYSIISADTSIGDRTWIGPHVVISGHTRIGRANKIYQFSSIGEAPQHLGYDGEDTVVEIGDENIVREYTTINRGTLEGGGVTRLGDSNFLMAYVHIAHDCVIGSHTIFANCASLAGHVTVSDYAILGGFTLVHQFCRIGAHSITGIGCVCLQDVPPFTIAAGNRAQPHGINVKGLRRRNFEEADIIALKRAYKTLYRSEMPLKKARERMEQDNGDHPVVRELIQFLDSSDRGMIR